MKLYEKNTSTVDFLHQEMGIPLSFIDMALRYQQKTLGPLPIVLLQYGLITIDQLKRIYDWLEEESTVANQT